MYRDGANTRYPILLPGPSLTHSAYLKCVCFTPRNIVTNTDCVTDGHPKMAPRKWAGDLTMASDGIQSAPKRVWLAIYNNYFPYHLMDFLFPIYYLF